MLSERLIALPNEERVAKLGDLNMLALTGGRERTREEFAALIAATGFRREWIVEVDAGLSVIEAVPV